MFYFIISPIFSYLFISLTHTIVHEFGHAIVANYYIKTHFLIELKWFCTKVILNNKYFMVSTTRKIINNKAGFTSLSNNYIVYSAPEIQHITSAGSLCQFIYSVVIMTIWLFLSPHTGLYMTILKFTIYFVIILLWFVISFSEAKQTSKTKELNWSDKYISQHPHDFIEYMKNQPIDSDLLYENRIKLYPL